MADLILASWINQQRTAISGSIGRDTPVNTGLNLTNIANGTRINDEDINDLIDKIEGLKSNTFLAYADYPNSFSRVVAGQLATKDPLIQTETVIASLKNICQNITTRQEHTGNSYSTGFFDGVAFSTSANSTGGNSTTSVSGNGQATGNGQSYNGTWECRGVHNGASGYWTCGNYQTVGNNTASNSTTSISGNGQSTGNGQTTGNGQRYFSPDFAYNNNTPAYTTYSDFSVKYINGAYQVTQNSNT